MFNFMTVFRREMSAYFNSAIAYIFFIVFVLINSGLFMTQFFLMSRADMRPLFNTLPFLLAVFLPAVTMRSWAEEKKQSTLELLLTFPMSPEQLVLGKFSAAVAFYALALAATFPIPVMLHILGTPDTGVILGGYLGSLLIGAFYIAAGIFISGLVREQIVAFIVSMMVCFLFYLVGTEFLAASIDGWSPGLGTFLEQFVGVTPHFESFAKGVVDLRDVLYFVIGTVPFLVLNGFWLEGRLRPRATMIFSAAAVICAGIFLASSWLTSDLPLGRYDLTDGKLYTISNASRDILSDLKAPVIARLYISPPEKMPTGMKTVEQDITGKLEELSLASGGKFEYKILHLDAANIGAAADSATPETLEEQLAVKGIQPFQVQSIDSDEVGVKLVYSTLSLAYKEKAEELIQGIMPGNLYSLEYLIVSKVFRMTLPAKPVIAMAAPFEEQAMDPTMAALLMQLGGGKIPERYKRDKYDIIEQALGQEGYEVSRIHLTEAEPIPEGAQTLLILEPQGLNERQRFEINRFLVNGGSVFMAVQNYEYQYNPIGGRLTLLGTDKKPSVNPLLENWGLAVDRDVLADKQNEVINLSGRGQLGPFGVSVPVKAPIHILVTPNDMNPDLSITAHLSSLFYLWGTALKVDEEKVQALNLDVETLFQSSQDSWTVPYSEEEMVPSDFDESRRIARGPFPLAVFVKGLFPNAYKGRDVPAWPPAGEETAAEPAKPEQEKVEYKPLPGKLILTGAATPFQKQLIQNGGHANLFLNAVDVLTLGEELVSIRSREPIDHSIGRVDAGEKIMWRLFVTVLTPLMIAVAGLFLGMVRSRSKQNYMKSLNAQ